ncbi:MAG: DM13 domain-containing protein [Candidatus Woesearchaeota archaeon]|nr:MAG: DM13 domain-containing protein [Candidatus Woesearchaeota archaeon]
MIKKGLIITLLVIFLLFLTSCSKNIEEMTDDQKAAEEQTASSLQSSTILKTGSFEGRAHPTSGEIKIVESNGEKFLVLPEDFQTDSGPLLHVILAEHQDPMSSSNLHEGQYIDLGVLKSTKGTQAYKITEGDLEKFNTVVIYCKPFKVVFGVAKLS